MRYDAVAPSVPQYEHNEVPNFGSGVRRRVGGRGGVNSRWSFRTLEC